MREFTFHTDRRTVLKTAGGLFAGATVLAGPGAAQEDELQLNVQQEAINPEENGVIPAEVSVPPDLGGFDTSNFLMGVGDAFEIEEEIVYVAEGFEDGVASPINARSVPGDELILEFDNEDIRYPKPDSWDGTMGLGLAAPDDYTFEKKLWDTDTVQVGHGWVS